MSKLIFENLTTEQADMLASWFEGQGEQDCYEWFGMHDIPAPSADIHHKPSYKETLDNGDVILYCR